MKKVGIKVLRKYGLLLAISFNLLIIEQLFAQPNIVLNPNSGLSNIVVTVNGSGFDPNEDSIGIHFQTMPERLSITPLNGTVAGTLPNTVRARGDGTWEASFNAPALNGGLYLVKAVNENGPTDRASANFNLTASNIIGRVFNSNNPSEGIVGATVILEQGGQQKYQTTTIPGGGYTFSGIAAGSYDIKVTAASGYQVPASFSANPVSVPPDASNKDIGLTPSSGGGSTISGRAFNENNQSQVIAGAKVVLKQNGNPVDQTFTNSEGDYAFINVPAGSYDIEAAEASGYLVPIIKYFGITVPPDAVARNLGLTPSGGGGSGNVGGKIFNVNNPSQGISGARVILEQDGQQRYELYSNNEGYYGFTNVTAGTYMVKVVEASGYNVPVTYPYPVAVPDTTPRDIGLMPTTPQQAGLILTPSAGPASVHVYAHVSGLNPSEQIQVVKWKWTGGEMDLSTIPGLPLGADPSGNLNFEFNVPSTVQSQVQYEVVVMRTATSQIQAPFFVSDGGGSGGGGGGGQNNPANVTITNVIVNSFLVTNPNNLANQLSSNPFQIQINVQTTGYVILELKLKDNAGKEYFRGKTIQMPMGQPGPMTIFPMPGIFSEVWSDNATTQLPAGVYNFSAEVVSGGGSTFNINIPVTVGGGGEPQTQVLPPMLINPVETSVPTQIPTFMWTPVPGANKYKIWVSLQGNPENDPIWTETVNHPMTQIVYPSGIRVLENGVKYYWRIQSLKLNEQGQDEAYGSYEGKSGIASFTIGAGGGGGVTKIIVMGPKDEIELGPMPLMFMWAPVPNVFGYLIMLSKDPSMNMPIWKMNVGSTSIIYPPDAPKLEPKEQYFWGVIALDQNGLPLGAASGGGYGGGWGTSGVTSDVIPFRIRITEEMIGKIHLIGPREEIGRGQPIMFIWNPARDVMFYQIELSENPDIGNPIWKAVVPSSTVMYPPDAPPLKPQIPYFWRVSALDKEQKQIKIGELEAKSEIAKFSMGVGGYHQDDKIMTMLPKGEVGTEQLMFIWGPHKDAKGYMLVLSQDPGFANMLWQFNTPATSVMYPMDAPKLEENKQYFWMIVALDENNRPLGAEGTTNIHTALKSEPSLFIIKKGAGPGGGGYAEARQRIIVMGPKGDVPKENMMFIWAPQRDAVSYFVAIAEDPSLNKVIWKGMAQASSMMYPPDAPPLQEGIVYHWGVIALDKDQKPVGGESLEQIGENVLRSDIHSFKIVAATGNITPPTGYGNRPLLPLPEIERILRDKIKDPKIQEALKEYILIIVQMDPPGMPGEIEEILEALTKGEAEFLGAKIEEK